MRVDVHRDGRAKIGHRVCYLPALEPALAPEVHGRRPMDRVWPQAEIAVPAVLTLLMVASRTRRHAKVVPDSAAGARVAIKFREADLRLTGDLSGLIREPTCRQDPRQRASALQAELGIAAQFGNRLLDVDPGVVGPAALGLDP